MKDRLATGKYCLNIVGEVLQVGVETSSGPKVAEFPLTKLKAETVLQSRIVLNLLLSNYLEKGTEGINVPNDVVKQLRNEVKILSFFIDGWTETSVNFVLGEVRVISTSYEKGMRRRTIPLKDISWLVISKHSDPTEFFALERYLNRGVR